LSGSLTTEKLNKINRNDITRSSGTLSGLNTSQDQKVCRRNVCRRNVRTPRQSSQLRRCLLAGNILCVLYGGRGGASRAIGMPYKPRPFACIMLT